MKKNKTVIVGMSGGVDSSVTAGLLKKRGYNVIGITMQLLPKEQEHQSACCNLNAVCDAQRVAQRLGIPHYTVNLRDPFKTHVIDYFVKSYVSGVTPNPCVECNRYIKFDELLKKADELGAYYVATGHYCQRTFNPRTKEFHLKKGKDPNKDQSYFLYMLENDILKRILFPLGGFFKSEIREMAREMGFVNANKADSQEICFVTKDDYKQFIESNNDPIQTGHIVDTEGKVLGTHNGIHQFTIGQRKGLGIATGTPLFVLKINAHNNTVVVGTQDQLKSHIIEVDNVTLVNQNESLLERNFEVKTRYRMAPIMGNVTALNGRKLIVHTQTPQSFVTPGQSLVLYKGDRIIGGGIITGTGY